MTKDDIIRMAREAGFTLSGASSPAIERFAKIVAAAEREACIKVIESERNMDPDWQWHLFDAIRSRGYP